MTYRSTMTEHRSRPIAQALANWADEVLGKLSRKSELAAA